MALKEVWYGSYGPFLYDTDDAYPDGVSHEPVHEFDIPTEPGSGASKEYVDQVMQAHLEADNPHPQYMTQPGYYPSDHERRGRLFEVDDHHNPRINYVETR